MNNYFQPDTLPQCSYDMCTCVGLDYMNNVHNGLRVVVNKLNDSRSANVFMRSDSSDEIRRCVIIRRTLMHGHFAVGMTY